MADEIPGEDAPEEQEGEVEYDGEGMGKYLGEVESKHSTETLVSDFCKPEESSEEVPGEALWVCEQQEDEGGYYAGWQFGMEEEKGEGGEEDMEDLLEKRSLDSEYLKAVLGTPLTFALLDIADKRPIDPIQYLGQFLLKWRWGREDKAKYEEKIKQLTEERDAYHDQLKEKERQIMLESVERQEELRRALRNESSEDDDEDLGEGQELGG